METRHVYVNTKGGLTVMDREPKDLFFVGSIVAKSGRKVSVYRRVQPGACADVAIVEAASVCGAERFVRDGYVVTVYDGDGSFEHVFTTDVEAFANAVAALVNDVYCTFPDEKTRKRATKNAVAMLACSLSDWLIHGWE